MRRLATTLFTAFCAVLLLAGPALADALDEYRKDGLIIERYDGYTEPGPDAPADAVALAREVNAKRRQVYEARAAQNDAPVSEVGKVYAVEIFQKAPRGTIFRQPDGSLVRK